MKIRKTVIVVFLMLLNLFLFVGCTDRKSSNDELTVIFYTKLDTSTVSSTSIEPLFDVDKGSLIVQPEDPVAPGATFLGWYKEKSYATEWKFDTDQVEASMVLYARWQIDTLHISYMFDEAGGSFLDDPITDFTVTQTLILPKADRLGSLFLGWILTPVDEYKVGNKIVKTTADFSEDVVLYALFENKEYTIRFYVLEAGVTNPKMYVQEYAADIAFPVFEDTATRHFVGWFSADGRETGDWGFQYINGEPYLGKVTGYDEETSTYTFTAQGTSLYAKWEDK